MYLANSCCPISSPRHSSTATSLRSSAESSGAMDSNAAPAAWRTVTRSLTFTRLVRWVAMWSRLPSPSRASRVSSRMLTSLRIHGVAAFKLSRNISDTASLGRAGGLPRPVISPMASSRSSAREGQPAQSTSRRAPSSTSWVEMAGRR